MSEKEKVEMSGERGGKRGEEGTKRKKAIGLYLKGGIKKERKKKKHRRRHGNAKIRSASQAEIHYTHFSMS